MTICLSQRIGTLLNIKFERSESVIILHDVTVWDRKIDGNDKSRTRSHLVSREATRITNKQISIMPAVERGEKVGTFLHFVSLRLVFDSEPAL
jgi:hypothetical protein